MKQKKSDRATRANDLKRFKQEFDIDAGDALLDAARFLQERPTEKDMSPDLQDFFTILEILLNRPRIPLSSRRPIKQRFDPANPLDPSLTLDMLFAAHVCVCRWPYIAEAFGRIKWRQVCRKNYKVAEIEKEKIH